MSNQTALARKTVTPFRGWVFGAAASAPMVVLVGGITGTYANSGVTALPLLFLIIGGVMGLLVVGYIAMARVVPHVAAFYAILARGLGPSWGVAGGMVASVFYNSLQISLYGLLGFELHTLIGGIWWVWAALAIAVVGVLGVRRIAVSTWVQALVLLASLLIILIFVVAGLLFADHGLSWDGFSVSKLMVPGLGGAVALTFAAFAGVETPASYGEEAVDENVVGSSVKAGTYWLAGIYGLAALAMGIAVGTHKVAAVAADPNGGLPFSVLQRIAGFLTPLSEFVLVLAILSSLLALHSVIARYTLGMASESVFPAWLARSNSRTQVDAPVGGSLVQTVTAVVVLAAFVVAGADPFATVFTWLSTLGALGLVTLMVASSVAALVYFNRPESLRAALGDEYRPGRWTSTVAPTLGSACGLFVLASIALTAGSQLHTPNGSLKPLLLPAVILAAAVVGLLRASWLRVNQREVYDNIGHGRPDEIDVPDQIHIRY